MMVFGNGRPLTAAVTGTGRISQQHLHHLAGMTEIEQLVAAGTLSEIEEVEVRLAPPSRAPGGPYADENLPHSSHTLPSGVIHEFLPHLCYLALLFLPSVRHVGAAWRNDADDAIFNHNDLDAIVIARKVHTQIWFSCAVSPDAVMPTFRGSEGWIGTDLNHRYARLPATRGPVGPLAPPLNQFLNGPSLVGSSPRNFHAKLKRKQTYEGLEPFPKKSYQVLIEDGKLPVLFEDTAATNRLIEAFLDEANQL